MLSSVNTNYNTISANKASTTENSVTKSADSQANKNEKVQNSQTPKVDTTEISLQARAFMQQTNAVVSIPHSSSVQNTENSTKKAAFSSSQITSKKNAYNPNEVLTGKTRSQMDKLVQQGVITKGEENKELKGRAATKE